MAIKLETSALDQLPAEVGKPEYDRSALTAGILHVGVGNFHRAHQAVYLDRLFALGESREWALCGAGVRAGDALMREKLEAQDWMTTVVELDPSGLTARVTGSMIDFIEINADKTIARMADPVTKIVSTTITEGGYYVDALTDGFDTKHPDIVHDAENPDTPKTVFGMVIKALRMRRDAGLPPFTFMSCDNLPENGHVAKRTVVGLAKLIDADFATWISENVAFPNSMVDCITPATSDRERQLVADKFGIVDAWPVACEPFRQWVMEDNFPQGRPALEKVGVEFVEDVAQYELMKLRILNGGHAAIAYPSALIGHHFVHDAMADPLIHDWLDALERREVIPTLQPIEGVDYQKYREKIIERFSNPEVGDTIPRLCLDGSNRQPKFILPTLRDALANGADVSGLALEVALWCRYCTRVDEAGNEIAPNDDNHVALKEYADAAKERPAAFLENQAVFGDLAQNETFVAAFGAALNSLYDNGVADTLRAYIAK
ncbi:mannitol dehydrogenase family protein [Marivivens donghaensis]|uniref:Mannitol dehydrogenase family protein n=1 Tax=Marivivens donghaensis TaxID=1699413 RepID=A0ABX0VTF8_9RHOB|nr:mannitol dehydrogenase family protein [Marivivens donghaensis]NIY71055.1 mannitol dehydrogenase family protein [Marivivens donghaensis]